MNFSPLNHTAVCGEGRKKERKEERRKGRKARRVEGRGGTLVFERAELSLRFTGCLV
jgi:hypothetical protein